MSAAHDDGWEQGCAFPDGVIHDHGNAQCHAATAVKTAQQAVAAFLIGLAQGEQTVLCENDQCRVRLYTVPNNAGRAVPICPGCYGSPGAVV